MVGDAGTASFTLNGNSISYIIAISRVDDVTGAHLHKGVEGTNGDIVVDLTGNPTQGSFSSSDLVGPLKGKTLNDLAGLMKEGKVYVNLHSSTYPDGELRGPVKSAN